MAHMTTASEVETAQNIPKSPREYYARSSGIPVGTEALQRV